MLEKISDLIDKVRENISPAVKHTKDFTKETVRSLTKNTFHTDFSGTDLSQVITEDVKPLRLLGNAKGAYFSKVTDVNRTDFQGADISTKNMVAILAFVTEGGKRVFGDKVKAIWKEYHTNTENIPQLDEAIFTIEEGQKKLSSILLQGTDYISEGNKDAIDDAKVALRITESTVKLLRFAGFEDMSESQAVRERNKTIGLFKAIAKNNPYFYEVAKAMLIMERLGDSVLLKDLTDAIAPQKAPEEQEITNISEAGVESDFEVGKYASKAKSNSEIRDGRH